MPTPMHDQLARIYHLARRIMFTPFWRPPVAAFAAGILLRLLGPRRAGVGAALAVLAGWLALVLPLNPFIASGPVARLPGAAVLLALLVQYGRGGRVPGWAALVLYGVVAAWGATGWAGDRQPGAGDIGHCCRHGDCAPAGGG